MLLHSSYNDPDLIIWKSLTVKYLERNKKKQRENLDRLLEVFKEKEEKIKGLNTENTLLNTIRQKTSIMKVTSEIADMRLKMASEFSDGGDKSYLQFLKYEKLILRSQFGICSNEEREHKMRQIITQDKEIKRSESLQSKILIS